MASPGRKAGCGLKQISPGMYRKRSGCITRPKGRVRIETVAASMSVKFCKCITRPKGRVRIETHPRKIVPPWWPEHHPAERPGAD